jgi:hypothetical protein
LGSPDLMRHVLTGGRLRFPAQAGNASLATPTRASGVPPAPLGAASLSALGFASVRPAAAGFAVPTFTTGSTSPVLGSSRSFVAAFICANLRQSADPPSGPPEKTSIESTESTESLIIRCPRPRFALAGRAAGGGRDGPSDCARPSWRDVPLATATNRYGPTERKGKSMTSGCLRSFAAPFIRANLRQSADSFRLLPCPSSPSSVDFVASCETSALHLGFWPSAVCFSLLPLAFPVRHSFSDGGCLLPCPSSPSFVDFVASCETSTRIIPKEPEIRGDPSRKTPSNRARA